MKKMIQPELKLDSKVIMTFENRDKFESNNAVANTDTTTTTITITSTTISFDAAWRNNGR